MKWRCKLQQFYIVIVVYIYSIMINRRWTPTIKPAGNQKLVFHCSIGWIACLWPLIWLLIIIFFMYDHFLYTLGNSIYLINDQKMCKRSHTRSKILYLLHKYIIPIIWSKRWDDHFFFFLSDHNLRLKILIYKLYNISIVKIRYNLIFFRWSPKCNKFYVKVYNVVIITIWS